MNAPAYEALMRAVLTEPSQERVEAVEEWIKKWTVMAVVEAQISDLHPRVKALELAAATRTMVETVALSGSVEKVLEIHQLELLPHRFLIEMTLIRHGVDAKSQPRLKLVPLPKKRT